MNQIIAECVFMLVSFVGEWIYRSLINNPALDAEFNDLRFGLGELHLTEPEPGVIGGTLGGNDWSLALKGAFTSGHPSALRWQGRGILGGEEWVYDYLGYLVPGWPDGIGQVPTIVGTVIRTAAHSDGGAKAGYTASFYAVLASNGSTSA